MNLDGQSIFLLNLALFVFDDNDGLELSPHSVIKVPIVQELVLVVEEVDLVVLVHVN